MKRRNVQLLVNGAIDTKTNPKLVKAPAVLQMDNMTQLRTGEFRARNGFNALASSRNITIGDNLYVTPQGGIGSTSRGWLGVTSWPSSSRYGNATATTGWEGVNGAASLSPFPAITARVTQLSGQHQSSVDQFDPDMLFQGGARVAYWISGVIPAFEMDAREAATGKAGGGVFFTSSGNSPGPGLAPLLSATGGGYAALFSRAGGANVTAFSWLNGFAVGVATTPVTDLHGIPLLDAKAIPGTSKIALAWKAAAGGIKCAIYDPAVGTVSSTVATAGGDATMCLGWLDDQTASGNMYLATAGSTSGIVVRVMSATNMVVSSTQVISAAATSGIRNITGHTKTATTYNVIWSKDGPSAIYDQVIAGYWNASTVALVNIASHMSLYSRSAKFADGNYYVLGVLVSPTQGAFTVIPCDTATIAGTTTLPAAQCYALSGEGGGRRQACSLSTPVSIGSTIAIAVARSKKINTPGGGTANQAKTIAILSLSQSFKLTHARELGGTVFMPGGVLQRDDGIAVEANGFPIYPEPCTGVSAAGGSMTVNGVYLYRTVLKTIDATGRIVRSAASIPTSITLGAADTQVTLTLFNLQEPRADYLFSANGSWGLCSMEIYRQGPAASGATLYNKVGETSPITPGTSTTGIVFVDQMSDVNAALGEVAYFNGNILENFSPPSHTLLEVNGNRVGIVNAENPTEFWYSKEYKAGVGLGFNPLLNVNISGDGYGDLTGLAAMNGAWILFKRQAIYVMTGAGPDDTGAGTFNPPRAVSRTLGTINPSSILETPDGIMFQTVAGGIWLLDLGFGLQYVGSPVEQYAIAETVTGSAVVAASTTARFLFPSGKAVEYDYFHKRWYVQQYRVDRSSTVSTAVDCVNSALFGWCYLLANGDLMQEVAGRTQDTNGTSTAIVPVISLPHLDMGGLAGYQRFLALDITIDVVGNFTISVDAEYDYAGSLTGSPKTKALTTATPTAQVEYLPPEGRGKCTAVRPVITISGSPAGGTFRLSGVMLFYGIKQGTNVPASSRLT